MIMRSKILEEKYQEFLNELYGFLEDVGYFNIRDRREKSAIVDFLCTLTGRKKITILTLIMKLKQRKMLDNKRKIRNLKTAKNKKEWQKKIQKRGRKHIPLVAYCLNCISDNNNVKENKKEIIIYEKNRKVDLFLLETKKDKFKIE